jgi:hypothetical protein
VLEPSGLLIFPHGFAFATHHVRRTFSSFTREPTHVCPKRIGTFSNSPLAMTILLAGGEYPY